MALKGTLKDFSVADIFQLIGQQQKSGSLYVRAKDREAHVIFDQGKVVLSTFRKSDEDFLLGTMLLRAGVITANQLENAVQNQKATLRSLGDILISMGAIAVSDLSEFVALQLKEVLFRLFQWKEGLYEFIPEQIRYNKTVIKPQSAEAVLMDCFRMMDEWPSVLQKIVTVEAVFRPLVDPTEMTQDAEGFTDEEKKVLRLLDGHRSLQEVIYLSRLGTFDGGRAVAGLMDRGLVIKLEQLSQTRIETKHNFAGPETLKNWLNWSYKSLFVLFILSLLTPILAFGIRSHVSSRFGTFLPNGRLYEDPASFSSMQRINNRQQIENLLRLYRFERGEYPGSLSEIVSDERAEPWEYQRTDGGFKLK